MTPTFHHPSPHAVAAPQPGGPGYPHATHPAPAATVLGVPLLPGERVVYLHRQRAATYHVVTTLRVIDGRRNKEPTFLWLPNIRSVAAKRAGTGGGRAVGMLVSKLLGGLLGGLLSELFSHAIDRSADRKLDDEAKTSTRYWERSEGLVFIAHGGAKYQIETKDAPRLGLLLANGMVWGGFSHLPSIGCPA